jgi:hypothetical protein
VVVVTEGATHSVVLVGGIVVSVGFVAPPTVVLGATADDVVVVDEQSGGGVTQ